MKVYSTKQKEFVLAPASLKDPVVFTGCFMEDDGKVRVLAKKLSKAEFTKLYKPVTVKDYPPAKLADVLLGFGRASGISWDALDMIGELIGTKGLTPMSDKETKTKAAAAKKAATKSPAKKPAAKKAAPAKKPAAKKPAAKKDSKESMKKPSAASRFKELIMDQTPSGNARRTDDEIFATVQKEFNLDDSKRSYVAWYRNDLKKKGVENVPEPKQAKK